MTTPSRAHLRDNALTAALLLACIALTITLFRHDRGQIAAVAVNPAVTVGREPLSQIDESEKDVLQHIIPVLDLGDHPKIAEAIDAVARSAHCAMNVNWKALEAQGVLPGDAAGMTGLHRNITVGQAIEHIFSIAYGTKFAAIDGAVYISNDFDFANHTQRLIYNVRDIIDAAAQSAAAGAPPDAIRRQDAVNQLTWLIVNSIDSGSWHDNGGNVGSISEINGLLVITQTPDNQWAIAQFLRQLRQTSRSDVPAKVAGTEPATEPPIDPALATFSKMLPPLPLQRPRTLGDALRLVQQASGRQILVDWSLLVTAGIEPDRPIEIAWPLEPMTVHEALKLILASVTDDLRITRQGNLIIVTTADELRRYTQLIHCNVRDLIDAMIAANRSDPDRKAPMTRQQAIDQLTQTITKTIDPDSWQDNGGTLGSIREIMGILIIQQTAENQDAVREWLNDLRKANVNQATSNLN